MSPRIRTAIALIIAVVICSYQLLGIGDGRFAAAWWPWLALLIVAAALAMNALALQRAGVAIGFGSGQRAATAYRRAEFLHRGHPAGHRRHGDPRPPALRR